MDRDKKRARVDEEESKDMDMSLEESDPCLPLLPPCEVERLPDILSVIKGMHPIDRLKLIDELTGRGGAYIVKLVDLFDLCELEGDRNVLHLLFEIFYSLVELCDRRVIEVLLNDENFMSVLGIFGYNPGLIREMDFRSELEGKDGYREVIRISDPEVLARVHVNFRIQVIKDNVLSRSLPDSSVIMLEQIVNENNYHILSYISDSKSYWEAIKVLLDDNFKRHDALGLLREIIQLVRVTRPLDRLPQQRPPFMTGMPVFGTLINNLFADGVIFERFAAILGAPDGKMEEIEVVLDILNILVFYQGPERLRTYLASEGKCVSPPRTDSDRLEWKPGASLFTALIYVFEQYEPTRAQMFTLLREIFNVPLSQDERFLTVLYPNYIHWILQPLKYSDLDDEPVLFALQDSIMELLTFCTEHHGYRVKYLFGRQPIASYVKKMLQSKNKLFVIHAVKFVRACVSRNESFFSRFLIQNDLFTPIFSTLKLGGRNSCAVSSAVLEFLAFIEKSNLRSLIEHIFHKFYSEYKNECPIVFEAFRTRYEEHFGAPEDSQPSLQRNAAFVQKNETIDADEERYWEKDSEMPPAFVNGRDESERNPQEVRVRSSLGEGVKLVAYDDEDEPASPLKEGDLANLSPSSQTDPPDEELVLPVRAKAEDTEEQFICNTSLPKKVKSPQQKKVNLFQKISWKTTMASTTTSKGASEKGNEAESERPSSDTSSQTTHSQPNGQSTSETHPLDPTGEANDASAVVEKRKRSLEESEGADSLLKKAKACPVVSTS